MRVKSPGEKKGKDGQEEAETGAGAETGEPPVKEVSKIPSSWGFDEGQMNMQKYITASLDAARRLAEDDMMLSTEYEVRVKLPDGKSYVTDLDIQTLQRAKGFREATHEEKGPWFTEEPTEDELKKLLELNAEAFAKQPQPSASRKPKHPKPQVAPEATEKASDQGDVVPTKCRELGCGKEFKRPCDLAKHEKTHSRPWKCAVPECKYHEYGLPTRRDLNHHVSANHSPAPPMYQCFYKPCPYQSKRESNCKQHMEKAHGWTYVRSKTAKSLVPKPKNTRDTMEPWSDPLGSRNGAATDDFVLHTDLFGSSTGNGITTADFQGFLGPGNGTATGDFVLFENNYIPRIPLFPYDYPESGSKESSMSFVNATAPTDSGYASMGRLNTPSKAGESTPQEVDVAETVYSVAQSVSEDDVEMYTAQFADGLADFVTSEVGNKIEGPQVVEALVRGLPQLLRAFALRLGSAGSSKTERDVMVFVHKQRNNIASGVQHALIADCGSNDSGILGDKKERVDMSTVHTFIRSWLDGLGNDTEHPSDDPHAEDPPPMSGIDNEDGDKDLLLSNREYTKIVFESPAYLWLTAAVKRVVSLAPVPGQETVLGKTYTEVLSCLDTRHRKVSSRNAPETITAYLTADWDPVVFLRHQFGESAVPLGRTITLTGSATDAQALPCGMYIRQTWPTSGPGLLRILQRALDLGDRGEGHLPDKTFVKFTIGSPLRVEVRGSADCVAEVTEQIAWLGAALRASDTEEDLSICSPSVNVLRLNHGTLGSPTLACYLSFKTHKAIPDPKAASAGQCWHKLFRNPVVVQGYPIPRRSQYNSGLEIPINMMSRLAGSPRLHQYMGKHLLKGFSTAVFPTATLDDALLWHFHCSDDGRRLPYPDLEVNKCVDIAPDELASRRHILGWCTENKLCAGTKGMNYGIKSSKLKSPGKEFSLEKISFSVGQLVTGGCQFSVGHRDIPLRITRSGFIQKLRWIRQRYFTLWDVKDNRGWLVDGASTLLHLLRASLHQSSNDDFSSEFLFDESKFCEAEQPFRAGAALEVLLNRTNRALDLYREEEKMEVVERPLPGGGTEFVPHVRVRTTTIQDRIEELYETLEKLVDHKHRVEASYKGVDAKIRLRDHLEGWDFADLAGDRDPFHLKVTTLPSCAASMTWVDYTRAIPSVTLFGEGFGELIRPAMDGPCRKQQGLRQQICLDWASVPKDQHVLCATVVDLQAITDRIGDASTNPLTLAPGILWRADSSSGAVFTRCGCERTQNPRRKKTLSTHPVQELSPSTMNFLHKSDDSAALDLSDYPNAAVIFGTSAWKWPWKTTSAATVPGWQTEDARKQETKEVTDELSDKTSQTLSFADSGILSLSSSSSLGMSTSGSGSSVTPPTSVTSDGSKIVGERVEGSKMRRAWWSSIGAGEGDTREGGGGDLLGRIKRARGI